MTTQFTMGNAVTLHLFIIKKEQAVLTFPDFPFRRRKRGLCGTKHIPMHCNIARIHGNENMMRLQKTNQ